LKTHIFWKEGEGCREEFKNKLEYYYMIVKGGKKNGLEIRTTLDTLHNLQIQQMNNNEKELVLLIKEKKEIESKISSIENEIEYDQLEHRLKYLTTEIESRKEKNEFLDYYLDTGDILYNYYDIQEKIQEGTLVTNNKKKIGAIFDSLEKASDKDLKKHDEVPIKNSVSRDKLLEQYLKKVHPDSVKTSTNISGFCIK
jgi:hypothetical protein